MILTPPVAKSLCWAAALSVHGAVIWAVVPDGKAQIAGGAVSTPARLGNSFADLAAGTLNAQGATQETAAALVKETPATLPAAQAKPTTALATPRVAHDPAKGPQAQTYVATPTSPKAALAPGPGAVATPVVPDLAAIAAAPNVTGSPALAQNPTTAQNPEPRPTPKVAAAPPPDATRPNPETLVIESPETADPARSLRPKKRSSEVAKRAAKAARPAPTGNAERTTRAGAVRKSGNARSGTTAEPKSTAAKQGNAAADNYPGQVLARLRRIATLRLGVQGAAVVQFTIAPNGRLSGIAIARSSGSRMLDRAAVQAIRRVAPFPKPPPGARRTFSLTLRGT